MAVTILPRKESYQAPQQESFGKSLGEGLSRLITHKVEELKRKQGIKDRGDTFKKLGLPEELANLPYHMQELFIKEFEFAPPEKKEEIREEAEEIKNQYWPQQEEEQTYNQETQMTEAPIEGQNVAGPYTPLEENKSSIPGLSGLVNAGSGQEKDQSEGSRVQSFPSLGRGTKGQVGPSSSGQPYTNDSGLELSTNRISAQRGPQLVKKSTAAADRAEEKDLRKEKAAEVKEEKKAEQTGHKESYPYYQQIESEAKAAKEMNRDTDRMLKLINEGSIANPAVYKILKGLEDTSAGAGAAAGAAIGGAAGLASGPLSLATSPILAATGGAIGAGIGAITSPLATLLRYGEKNIFPDTEEFEKLSASMIRGAKAMFGSRFTEKELILYMDTLPTLTQTDKGKKAVIRDIKLASKAAEVKAKHMHQIIRENGNRRPADLQEQTEQRSAKEIDKLAERFIEGS